MKRTTSVTDNLSTPASYLSLEELEPSPGSRLYSLPPIGLGTGLVESLTSYMARLARAHRITPGQLFTRQILSLTEQLPPELRLGQQLPSTFGGYNRFFNGSGKPAAFVTAALANLTLQQDLIQLSMLRWRKVISSISLSKKVRAWCVRCFRDWRRQDTVLFEPLLWTINIVTVCPVHHLTLTSVCPACGRRSPPLEGRLRVGHCAKCDAWLGQRSASAHSASSVSDGLDPKFIANELREAFELVPDPVTESTILDRIKRLIKNRRHIAKLASAANLTPLQLNHITNGGCRISLKTLLILCRRFDVSLKELLCPHSSILTIVPAKRTAMARPARWRKSDKLLIETIRTALAAAAAETEPIPLHLIAHKLGCAQCHLRKYFPELCKRIKLKRKRFQLRRYRQVAALLRQALRRNEPASAAAVARELGISWGALHKQFPDLMTELTKRHREFQRQTRVTRRTEVRESILRTAHKLHEQGQYPSIRKLFRELDGKLSRDDYEFVSEVLTARRRKLELEEGCAELWN